VEALAIVGYVCLALTGVSLGLLGAGGSILGVPILVYLLSVPPGEATGYSLVLVGATALVGAFQMIRSGYAHPRMAWRFGAPSIVGVYLSRRVVFPAVPDPVFDVGSAVVSKDTFIMVIFAAFMVVAAVKMIRTGKKADIDEFHPHHYVPGFVIALAGLGVGVLTGFVGAGGGFLVLPVLVLKGGLPIRMAIGTSLLIIAAKSLLGFVGEVQARGAIDYLFIATILVPAFIGIVAGTWLSRRAPATGIKKGFGWFLLVVGAMIVARELWTV
jgi:uncharacterized membrane protein YfcA